MTDLLPVTIERNGNEELVLRMTSTIDIVREAPSETVTEIHRSAAMTEAAAKIAEATDVQLAAARLRLEAERRMGKLSLESNITCLDREMKKYRDLARIPATWTYTGVRLVEEQVDLWEKTLEHQLVVHRSHTARAVYLGSVDFTFKRKRAGLLQGWDESWLIIYESPTTGYNNSVRFNGTYDEALQKRGELLGRLDPEPEERGTPSLGRALTSIRKARQDVGLIWGELSHEQKVELDGVYASLDDAARAIVIATNL